MNNDKLKFVVDSRSFDGSCVTTMSDGIHGDYHHETLEELRDREKNPCLTAVSGNTVRKMIRIHLQSPVSYTHLIRGETDIMIYGEGLHNDLQLMPEEERDTYIAAYRQKLSLIHISDGFYWNLRQDSER